MLLTHSWVYCLAGLSPHGVNNCLTFDSHNSSYNQGYTVLNYNFIKRIKLNK